MTERTGRHPRWSVAALLAPASAAVFAGTMSWTAGHPPTTAATVAATSAGQSQSQLEEELALRATQVDELRAQVSGLRDQVAALKAAGGNSAGGNGAGGNSAGANGAGSESAVSPSAKATKAPAPAKAPATHATTGASQ